ncbi:MAG: aminoacetone oxidase family FAD-binding enzyme [Erysipelotrichia bacterium]|nr:aminoacetone oxidase family FAD-binding enzyme [Erysipelotrichia bacterium]
MKIAIIGGGAAGVFLALRLKEEHPAFRITIFEKNNALLKKLLVTGNGRCNYANIGPTLNKYHNDDFANRLLKEFTPQDIIKTFDRLGIHPQRVGHLIYPISNSAASVVSLLKNHLDRLDIEILLQQPLLDYFKDGERYVVVTDKGKYDGFNAIVFATGGSCYPQLGTDGSIFQILQKHHYEITPLSPSLSPIKVKENTKKISGQRVKCLVSLLYKGEVIYQESGEVLFKNDGLSGIVILNMSQKINMLPHKGRVKIMLNLAPNHHVSNHNEYLEYVTPKLAEYLINNRLDINRLVYTFKGFYSPHIAEVSHGGLSLEEVSDSLQSKKEKGIYFCGEILDVDGMCGGFNLMFAFASAEKVKRALSGK